MTYMVARFYSGQSDLSIEQIYIAIVAELIPRLVAAGGLQRYGVVALDNGQIGSVSAYDDQAAAERSIPIGRDWVAGGGIQGYQLTEAFIGDRIFSYYAEGKDQATMEASGVTRVYQTSADVDSVVMALEDEAGPIARTLDGVLRYEVIKLADGSGYVSFTACETPAAAEQFTRQAKESRTTDSKLGKAFPQDPEVIAGRIVGFYTP